MSKNKSQIHKAIVNHGGTQFTVELNMLFHNQAKLQITHIEFKKDVLSAFANKQLVCRFFNCPVYVEYV